ncbi:hypothetical protein RclHR1_02900015 [Rhizophagus clarus]|uniref:Uncharacterized protein n=1 Tax=Rhizophagus clarus TaxID=94130 RepID=A0A2Z6R7Z4_9GLOM|nr:hypothetical protein RclHR1_02900015 [Rhizophagus clarus]GES81374.1 hypothetical protein GLOIN_2v1487477 [Rhizophagus clarus]
MSYTKRDSGFGESLSLGGFNVYLGLSDEKKIKGSQVFIENFTDKKLEEIFPKKNLDTHNVRNVRNVQKNIHQSVQNVENPCDKIPSKPRDYIPFTSYLGLDRVNRANGVKIPIIVKSKSKIDTDYTNIPLPSAAEISINRSLQLIRETSTKLKNLKNSRLNQIETKSIDTKIITERIERIRNLLRN